MNILPLICGLLIVFSCLAFTFLREAKSLGMMESSLTAAARTEREVNNRLEERRFLRIRVEPKDPLKSPPSKEVQKKKVSFFSRRTLIPPIEPSKLSIASLFEGQADVHNDPLYQIAERLLHLLYDPTSIVPREDPSWAKRLLDAVIAKEKSLEDGGDLPELFPEDPELAALYYKMLKGTNQYDVGKKRGIPPLADFMTLSEEKPQNAVYFAFASPPLLQALFDERVAREIMAAEKQEWEKTGGYHLFGKEELQALSLTQPAAGVRLAALEGVLNFSKQIPPKELIAGKDKQIGLTVKRKC